MFGYILFLIMCVFAFSMSLGMVLGKLFWTPPGGE